MLIIGATLHLGKGDDDGAREIIIAAQVDGRGSLAQHALRQHLARKDIHGKI
jgi:hypothetical protein